MKPTMVTHRERIQTTLSGEKPDRIPIALWRHFPVDDQAPEALAAAALHFQESYDFDIVKVTPASSFAVKDWGADDEWIGDTEGTRKYTRRVISTPGDWEKLRDLEPSATHLAAQLECLRMIRVRIDRSTPVIQTVFSPMAQAKNLAGNETLLAHLRAHPDAVLKGLEIITRTTARFVEAAAACGIDGIFYAVQHAQAGMLSLHEYEKFGLPFDLRVMQAAHGLWCSILHLHGKDVHFALANLLDFPIVNWHDQETSPSLKEARALFNGTLCAGLNQDTLVLRDRDRVITEARLANEESGGTRFILGTGCVVPVIASHGNLLAARHSADEAQ